MTRHLVAALCLSLGLLGFAGPAFAQDTAPALPPATMAQEPNERVTATDGDAATRGADDASAAPGTVVRPSSGTALLGPDGTYRVTENAPSNVVISGDTEVLSPPPAVPAEPTGDGRGTNAAGCASYGSWYDAQVAYEAAGLTGADPALVAALDPDYDGIACEEGM